MSLSVRTKTVNDVIAAVKREFGDESGAQITDSDIIRWINSAQLEIATKNAVIEAKYSTDSVANQADYNLPSEGILEIQSIHYKGVRIPYMNFQEAERSIFDSDPQRSRQGVPELWYEWANSVSFWPKPSESVVGGITIYCVGLPGMVQTGSDLLSLPDKYFEAVFTWVMSKAYALDEEWDASNMMRQNFSLMLDEKNGDEFRNQTVTYPTISIVE